MIGKVVNDTAAIVGSVDIAIEALNNIKASSNRQAGYRQTALMQLSYVRERLTELNAWAATPTISQGGEVQQGTHQVEARRRMRRDGRG